MFQINENFDRLPKSYLFSRVAAEVADYRHAYPESEIIRMDIGDVTRPICGAAIAAMRKAVDDMAHASTFKGYGPEQGYDFLRQAISQVDYKARGIDIEADEIFVNDGAKSDIGNFTDLFGSGVKVAVTDPVYPVYVDSNVIAGNAGELKEDGRWSNLIYLDCTEEHGFLPSLPKPNEVPDVVYLCFPNNPTGVGITRAELKKWVDYAIENKVLILYDSAYEAFVTSPDGVRSIFEIEGAKNVAVEFRSFSKTAGFTGLRCGYTVVPKELRMPTADGRTLSVGEVWNRRQSTKFNGASYVVQCAAAALYTPEGQKEIAESIDYYRQNARLLHDSLTGKGYNCVGGIDSPYIWLRDPEGRGSWEFFRQLLSTKQLTCTPGEGFGRCGKGWVRLTAFNTHENTRKACDRF